MEERIYLINLYDIYSDLLSDKKCEYFEYYYFDNLSLGEIAENNNVSRNAIHKHIKSTEEKLCFYESKLKLYEKDNILRDKLKEIDNEEVKKIIRDLFDKI